MLQVMSIESVVKIDLDFYVQARLYIELYDNHEYAYGDTKDEVWNWLKRFDI